MSSKSLSAKIVLAMMAGLLTGGLIHAFFADLVWLEQIVVNGLFKVVGAWFLQGLQMLVLPLVTFSLLSGVIGVGDVTALGRVGLKTLAWYLLTTAIAISLALTLAWLIDPGRAFEMTGVSADFQAAAAPPLTRVLIDLVPSNPVKAFADGNMLQIILFVMVFGLAVVLAGNAGRAIAKTCDTLNQVMMRMVGLVMATAPFGVFCLIARTFAEQGFGLLLPMLDYIAVVVLALVVHVSITFSLLLTTVRLNPLTFFQKMRAAQLFAFSTASSNATIPVNLNTAEHRLGVDNRIAAFTIPLGATINMDGTAIMQGAATVFIANVYGIDLSLADYLTVIAMAVLASIGTAGVPGVGLIMLAMVFAQVNLPVAGIGLVLGVDRLLDMLRTVVNITGDAVVTCLVAISENNLDRARFGDRGK